MSRYLLYLHQIKYHLKYRSKNSALFCQDPQPPEPWTGIREAKDFGNSCAQFDVFTRELVGSDDCLYLNVYTPSIEATSRRAVMVWIHGGGFVHGSGDSRVYGPDYLIRKDVVLVAINYRLAVLGGYLLLVLEPSALNFVHRVVSHFQL